MIFQQQQQVVQQNSQCFGQERIINAKWNQNFIRENQCQICFNLAKKIYICQGCNKIYGQQCIENSSLLNCQFCQQPFNIKQQNYQNNNNHYNQQPPQYINWRKTAHYLKNIYQEETPITIRCVYFNNGCPRELSYDMDEVSQHEVQCQYRKTQCPYKYIGCTWKGLQVEYDRFHTDECNFVQKECIYCKEMNAKPIKYKKQDLLIHYNHCQYKKIINLQQEVQKKSQEFFNQQSIQNQKEADIYNNILSTLENQKKLIIQQNKVNNNQENSNSLNIFDQFCQQNSIQVDQQGHFNFSLFQNNYNNNQKQKQNGGYQGKQSYFHFLSLLNTSNLNNNNSNNQQQQQQNDIQVEQLNNNNVDFDEMEAE